jgi:membrane-associated phospholipid phosphatase
MNAESSRLRSTGKTSSGINAIWPGALLVVYLTATGLLLIFGKAELPTTPALLHAGVLILIAATTWLPILPHWLRRWAPLLVLLFLYSEMPLLIQAAGHHHPNDVPVIHLEKALFGGQPALLWAQRWPHRLASELLHAAYLSYYAIIFAVPAALALKRRDAEFDEAVFVLMLIFVACFTVYLFYPVAGPRYLFKSPADAIAGPIRRATVALLQARSSMGTAFPSSHVAVAVTQSILAVHYFGRKGLVVGVLTIGLAAGAVYGGFHYLVDVIAGALLGAVVSMIGLSIVRRRAVAGQANATAPT